ncbi:ABC transporter substrate-binding protein [Paenibacillus tarimensis]
MKSNQDYTLKVVTPNRHLHDWLQAKSVFERLNPHIGVSIIQAADNFAVMKQLESDSPPDIVHLRGYDAHVLDAYCIDHYGFLREDQLEEDIYEGVLRVARSGERLSAIPMEVTTSLILYDKSVFDREGVAYPSEDWTWNDFSAVVQRLSGSTGSSERLCGLYMDPDIENFEPFVMRSKGSYLSSDGTTARGYLNSPRTIEALDNIIALYRSGSVSPSPLDSDARKDCCAMKFQFSWSAAQIRDEGKLEQFGCVGLPGFPNGTEANMLYMDAAGVTRQSSNPGLAWAFLRLFLFESPDRFKEPWDLPITRSLAARTGMNSHPLWSRFLDELAVVQKSAFYLNKNWNAARQRINHDILDIIRGDSDLKKSIQQWLSYV